MTFLSLLGYQNILLTYALTLTKCGNIRCYPTLGSTKFFFSRSRFEPDNSYFNCLIP